MVRNVGFDMADNQRNDIHFRKSRQDRRPDTRIFEENYWQAHWNIANTYYYDKMLTEPAVLEWQEVTRIKPNHWQAFYNLGEVYLNEGKIELAILEWDKVVSLNPKFWHVFHNLGTLFYKQGKLEQAMAYWTKAIALMLFSF